MDIAIIILAGVGFLLAAPSALDALFGKGAYNQVVSVAVEPLHRLGRRFQNRWLVHWEVQQQIEGRLARRRSSLAQVKRTRTVSQILFLAIDALTAYAIYVAVTVGIHWWQPVVWLVFGSTRILGLFLLSLAAPRRARLHGRLDATKFLIFGTMLVSVQSVPGTISLALDLLLSPLEGIQKLSSVEKQLFRFGTLCILTSFALNLWKVIAGS